MFNGSDYPALVLNSDHRPLSWLPLSLLDWRESVCSVLTDKVVVLSEYEAEVHSARRTMTLPSVVVLKEYIKRRDRPSLTRHNLIVLRDRQCCAYCGKTFGGSLLTYDHVVPRSKGGGHTWTNIVSCCLDCNQRKRDRTPDQAKMPLLWRPHQPTTAELARTDFFVTQRKLHESWKIYLEAA